MKRLLLGAAVLAAAFLLLAPSAWAHGGQFRGPGGQVPPGLREPTDPTPPPPPPPSGPPPVTPTPTTPTPTTPPPATPPTGAPPPTPTPDVPTPTGPRKPSQTSFEDWTFWYHNNNDTIENLKRALYTRITSGNPLFEIGGQDEKNKTSATRPTAKKVRDDVIPALIWAMDPQNAGHQDTESASYIALAKIATEPQHIQRIMSGLDKALKREQIVQESAALALGLLRRADKADQFEARELDKVREVLFQTFQDGDYADRVRGFAAMALGLLGDQPTGSGDYASNRKAAEEATTARLFDLLKTSYSSQELPISLLVAIGLQSPASVTAAQREVLSDAAYRGRLYKENLQDLPRAYACLALGRIGDESNIGTLENVLLAKRGMGQNVQRSAAIGLGLLGRLVEGPRRVEVAEVLLKGIDRVKENSTINFALMALSDLLVEEVKAGSTSVMDGSKAEETLLEMAEKGKYVHKPFAALALGLVAREITREKDLDAYQTFRERALRVLKAGVEGKGLDRRSQAGFCAAIGIAGDPSAKTMLVKIVADEKEEKELRGYAALALGLIGESSGTTEAIAGALQERSSEELRRQAAVALGLMGNPTVPGTGKDAVQILLDELREAKSQSHKGQIVIALARIGDWRAVDMLIEKLKDKNEKDLTRALCCAGLGLIGDLEWIPSLARISEDINYRASTDMIDEILSIL